MWDAASACGWGHASTTDFLRYTQHGCSGPDRAGGGVMSGSVALGAAGVPLMVFSYREAIYLARAPNSSMAAFAPPPRDSRPIFDAPASCNCSVADIRDPYMWSADDGSLFLLAGGGDRSNTPQALLWRSADGSGKDWSFVSKFWAPSASEVASQRYCRITSCVDAFTLPLPGTEERRQVFLFSDFELHRVRWFVGTLSAGHELQVEKQGVADWGRKPSTNSCCRFFSLIPVAAAAGLYAHQSMWDAKGKRRLMMGNIGHPHWMAGPDMLPIPIAVGPDSADPETAGGTWSQMVSLPREVSLSPAVALRFAPARELRAARQGAGVQKKDVALRSGAPPVVLGGTKGNVREMQLRLKSWAASGECGLRLRSSQCLLTVSLTAESVVVQSSCTGAGGRYEPLGSCPRNADDAKNTSALAGYCFNISLSSPPVVTAGDVAASAPVSTNVSLTAIVDKSVVEVFVDTLPSGEPGPVISSGVFVDAGSSEAVLELFCDSGGAATVDAATWTLAPPTE